MEERKYDKKQVEDGKLYAILSYIGLLCLIPFFTEKNNNFVMYHAKQGINLLILEAIAYVACIPLCFIFIGFILLPLVSAAAITFSILGIVNVCDGVASELPLIGKIKIVK